MKLSSKGCLLSVAIAATLSGAPVQASITEGVTKMVSEGTANLSLRYRYETVEEDNAKEDADASTLKSRLTLKSAEAGGFSALFEVDDVTAIGKDEYDSFSTSDEYVGTHSVVADPEGTEVNQAWVKYAFSESGSATVGRQRILHAGQRFVGGVGWRQNEQTYDAASVSYIDEGFSVDYSYVWRVNRIFDGSRDSRMATEFNGDTHMLLVKAPVPVGTVSGFAYLLDFDEALALSSATYGISYNGKFDPVSVSATVAKQTDYGDNPMTYDAEYLALEAKVAVAPVTITAGYELLGSDDGQVAFATPLATLHKFQGWTDQFLGTPAEGVEDIYLGLSGKVGGVALSAVYHDFSAEEDGATYDAGDDYGSEIDLVATYPVNKYVKVQLKYADYNADKFKVDTQKLWFSVMANF